MAYAIGSDIKVNGLIWAEEEKTKKLEDIFKNCEFFLPDDKFYTALTSKDDLLLIAKVLKKHLGIKSRRLKIEFVSGLDTDGIILLSKKAPLIKLSTQLIGRPRTAAAVLARLLCHFKLMQKGAISGVNEEDEKLADLATIESGLGLVIANGITRGGWREFFLNRNNPRRTNALGYFSATSYCSLLADYIGKRHYDMRESISYLVPWLRKTLAGSKQKPWEKRPDFIKSAEFYNNSSIISFLSGSTAIVLVLGFVAFYASKEVPLLDSELTQQKQKVDALLSSYKSCENRVSKESQSLDLNDQSIRNHVNGELVKCRSLRNQHNYEVKVYNELRQKYN